MNTNLDTDSNRGRDIVRKLVEIKSRQLEVYAPKNDYSLPVWQKFVDAGFGKDDLEILFPLYSFRIVSKEEINIQELTEILNKFLKDQRSMTPEERDSLDEFFWAELRN